MCLSGVVAEARLAGCGIEEVNYETWRKDWYDVRTKLIRVIDEDDAGQLTISQSSWDAEVEKAFSETQRLVAENWPLIERVAGALLKHGQLDRYAVLHLCGRLSPLKSPAILA